MHGTEGGFLPRKGNYEALLGYQKAEVLYRITFDFTARHLPKRDRTVDQMVQAARSGKQNLVEGSRAGVVSSESEIRLTNVARASLEELLEDYRDFLRTRDLDLWDKDSQQAQFVRALGRRKPQEYGLYREYVETRPAGTVANIAICLCHQANYLIDRQLKRLEQDFLRNGGVREQMARARRRSG